MTQNYEEMLRALESGALNPADFRHQDHIGVAYVAIKEDGFLAGTLRIATAIQRFAKAAGAATKFNTTITLAFSSLIAERMLTAKYENAPDFIAKNPDLESRSVLSNWYSKERLTSDMARSILVMPDRLQNNIHMTASPEKPTEAATV